MSCNILRKFFGKFEQWELGDKLVHFVDLDSAFATILNKNRVFAGILKFQTPFKTFCMDRSDYNCGESNAKGEKRCIQRAKVQGPQFSGIVQNQHKQDGRHLNCFEPVFEEISSSNWIKLFS